MSAVRVEQCVPSKSGKALRVMLSGKWYNSFLDSGLDKQVGNYIVAEIEIHDKFGASIKAWRPAQAAAPQTEGVSVRVAPGPQNLGAPSAVAAPYDERNPPPDAYERTPQYAEAATDNVVPWYWPSVSNICAAAIEKGLIVAPEQLNMWALKWAQVSVAVKEQVK